MVWTYAQATWWLYILQGKKKRGRPQQRFIVVKEAMQMVDNRERVRWRQGIHCGQP